MAYTKTNWQNGDLISAEKMNKIESGIADINDALGSFLYSAQGINTLYLCTQSDYDSSDKNPKILYLIKES